MSWPVILVMVAKKTMMSCPLPLQKTLLLTYPFSFLQLFFIQSKIILVYHFTVVREYKDIALRMGKTREREKLES